MSTHRPAIAATFDASDFAGSVVMSTATTGNVTIASGAGVFLDLPGFAHGYGSATAYTLEALINAAWPEAGTLTVGLDEAGLFYIESDTVDFAIDADPVNAAFGFDTAGHALVGGGAPFRQTAVNRFQRGIIDLDNGLMITPSGGSSTEMPTTLPRKQSLVTWIRERGTIADADDLYDGLTLEDALPAGSSCVVEPDGELSIETPAGEAISWPSTDAARNFARAVGHRGAIGYSDYTTDLPLDTEATDDGGRILRTGARWAPSFLTLRGIGLRARADRDGDEHTAGDGTAFGFDRYVRRGFGVSIAVSGPAIGRSQNRADALRSLLTRATGTVTIYPQWGSEAQATGEMELRRHKGMARVNVDAPDSSLLYTADADATWNHYGARAGGRLILIHSGDWSRADEFNSRADAMQDVELTLYVDPTEHPEAAGDV